MLARMPAQDREVRVCSRSGGRGGGARASPAVTGSRPCSETRVHGDSSPVVVLSSPEHPTELLQCGLPKVACGPPLVTARGESLGGAVQHVDARVLMT
jgi:hypothetical protein